MAKIRFGEIVADARGSIDGITYSRNRFGAYARNRVAPTNPNTSFQTVARENLAFLASRWRSITQVQRDAWSAIGSQIQKTDSLGQVYDLTGIQAYESINGVRFAIGSALVDDAPALDAIPQVDTLGLTATITGSVLSLAYTSANDVAAQQWLVYATRGLSAGKNFFRGSDYKLFFTFVGATASPVNIFASYTARFGALVLGTKISLLLVGASANRFLGSGVRVDAIVTA
jgi:hypothetical protein